MAVEIWRTRSPRKCSRREVEFKSQLAQEIQSGTGSQWIYRIL